MKNKLYKTAKAVVSSLLLLLFLLPACSDESGSTPDIPETKYAKLTITLGSADSALPSYTKAMEDNDIALDIDSLDKNYERHIDDWWIVVVKQNDDIVEMVLSNTNNDPFTTSNDDDNTHHVGVDLVIGETYKFYAFANLKHLQNTTEIIEALKVLPSQQFSTFRDKAAILMELPSYPGLETETHYIPMSSYVAVKEVSENVEANKVSLSLIRLLGKVEVEVTNSTGVDLTVNSVTMGKFRREGSVYLLPYDAITKDPDNPNLLLGKDEGDLVNPSFPGTGTLSDWIYRPEAGAKDQKINAAEDSNTQPYTFYINETKAEISENVEDLKIALDVTGEGIERDNTPKNTNFFFVRRNDFLKIPLLVSNAETTIGFEQKHMPIGGLPTQYVFNRGVAFSAYTYITDHAGEITISYSLNGLNGSSLSSSDPEWTLKYYDQTVNPGEHFCYAGLTDNTKVTSTHTGYLLVPDVADQDPLSWWEAAGNEENKKPECAFVLNKKMDGGAASTYQGSFTVTVQKLAKTASATIKLTLVAVNKAGTEVVLPYTLIIKNKEGGN